MQDSLRRLAGLRPGPCRHSRHPKTCHLRDANAVPAQKKGERGVAQRCRPLRNPDGRQGANGGEPTKRAIAKGRLRHQHSAVRKRVCLELSNQANRRDISDLMRSIQARTGWTPVRMEYEISYRTSFGRAHSSRKQAWRDLANKIDEMGPCVFRKGRHVVMLDGIREANGKFHLTIREPFHGTSLEFRDTAQFFACNGDPAPERAHLEAVFLKRPDSAPFATG